MADREGDWSRALVGRRILVTRAGQPGATLASRLCSLGAHAVHVPAIAFRAPTQSDDLDRAVDTLLEYDWIAFTSANAVDAFAERLKQRGRASPAMPSLAAVGASTAAAIAANGWSVRFVPSHSTGRHLADQLPLQSAARVLLPRADIADASLPSILRSRGAEVDDVIAYRTIPDPDLDAQVRALLRMGRIDGLTFTSPSCVTAFVDAFARQGGDLAHVRHASGLRVVCIGRTTAAAATAHDLGPDGISDESSVDGLIRALSTCLDSHAFAHFV